MADEKPICGILAGEPEIIGERCADGATCHHRCAAGCWRRTSCAPLSGSGLRYDWSAPALRAHDDLAGDRFEDPVAGWSAPAHDEREAPVVVATAILGGIYHGGSGPELGEIDIEVCMPALEALQCETVNSSDDVFLPLMAVAQHERIVAALTRPAPAELAPAQDDQVAQWQYQAPDGKWYNLITERQLDEARQIYKVRALYDRPAQTDKQPVAMQPDCDAVAVCGCRIVQSRKLGNVVILCAAHVAQTAPQPVSSALADVAAGSLADGCRGIAGLDHRFTPGPFSGARYCSKCGVAEDPDAARAAMRTYLGLDSEDA